MKSKLILIRGLSHSGSTIFDLSLSSHPSLSGLGEALNISPDGKKGVQLNEKCTCGLSPAECGIWGPIFGAAHWPDANELISSLYDTHKKQNQDIIGVIESSQQNRFLPKSLENLFDVYVIYVSKDIRSYSHSMMKKFGKSRGWFSLSWLWNNTRNFIFFKKNFTNVFRIGYEEFILDPSSSMVNIIRFLEIPGDYNIASPAIDDVHLVSGNRLLTDVKRRRNLVYDNKWMISRPSILSLIICVLFFPLNSYFVYSNSKDRL